MIAQRLSGDMRWVVGGAPAYLERFGTPATPDDLAHHRCLGIRLGDDQVYQWEFLGADGEFALSVPGPVMVNETGAMVAMAIAGTGLVYAPEPALAPHVRDGSLRIVLQDWAAPGPGYMLYYPSRRQVPMALRLLVELVREMSPLGL